MDALRPLWQRLEADRTIFQSFSWNRLAAKVFARRQHPFVVMAESDSGAVIIPACVDEQRISLLGEELFDYRDILHAGDDSILQDAWAQIYELANIRDFEFSFHSVRAFATTEWNGMPALPFTKAAHILAADAHSYHHPRLALNLRRLQRQGIELRRFTGVDSGVLKQIYGLKSRDEGSLFRDPLRVEMILAMAYLAGKACEMFTLQQGSTLVAALITFRDGDWRRFYTTYYNEAWAKHSPGLTLLYEVVRESLEAGFDCDFMTGEQPYKSRLATGSTPLLRIQASNEHLRARREQSSAQVA